MANRPTARREVTDVAMPQDSTAEGFSSLADTAAGLVDLQKKKDLADMNDFVADANIRMLDVTNKWRISNEGDPTNQEAVGKLHGEYDKILGQYSDKVGLLSRGDWARVSNKVKSQYQADNTQWGMKQTVVNMERRVNDGIAKNLQMFRGLGNTFDYNKLKNQYQTQRELLEAFAVGTVGQAKADEWLKNFHQDSAKMFIYGAAESDPVKAGILLDRQDVQADIENPNDIETLRNFIHKSKALQEEGTLRAQNATEDQMLTDYLLDSSKVDVFSVDSALSSKQIRPEFAQSLRRTIESKDTVGAKTDKSTFNKIVDYILLPENSQEQIRSEILKANAKGQLDRTDMQILNTFNQSVSQDMVRDYAHKQNPQSFFNAMRDFVSQKDSYAENGILDEVKIDMYKEYMQRVNIGEKPEVAVKNVIRNHNKKSNPKITTFSENGQLTIDAFGNKAKVYPNGDIEEVDQDAF